MSEGVAVFFDLGDTLANAVVDGGRLSRLEVYPFVPQILARLRAGDTGVPASLGLLSNTGDETAATMTRVLDDARLSTLVDPSLCLFSSLEGMDKSHPAFFVLARDRAGLPADRCVFVGENADERRTAASVGFRVSPHPLHALHLVETGVSAHP